MPLARLALGFPSAQQVKAETVLAMLLIARHRTARWALAFAAAGAALFGAQGNDSSGRLWYLTLGSVVAAVWGSRLLAAGGARESAASVPQLRWIPVAARLFGLTILVTPAFILLATLVSTTSDALTMAEAAIALFMVGVPLAALTTMLSPILGASGSASVGFVLATFGAVPPRLLDVVAPNSHVRAVLEMLWRSLPLPWRGASWLDGDSTSLGIALVWTAGCAIVAGRRLVVRQ